MDQCQAERLSELPRTVTQVVGPTPAQLHDINTVGGHSGSQQNRSRLAVASCDDIRHHVDAVAAIHVEMSGTKEHRCVAVRATTVRMRRRVVGTTIRLDLREP